MVLVGAECAALLQHGVDQRGLAVVDVRDDGDVANAQTQSMVCPLLTDRIDRRRTVHRRDAPSITLLCAEVSQEITSHYGAKSPADESSEGNCDSKANEKQSQPATAFSFGAGFPASRASTSFTARCAARMPPLVVDSGPSESVFAKKTRSKWLPHQRLNLRIQPRRRHIQRMSAPVDVHLDRIDVEPRHQLLEVAQHVGGDPPRAGFVQQMAALLFLHRRVAS